VKSRRWLVERDNTPRWGCLPFRPYAAGVSASQDGNLGSRTDTPNSRASVDDPALPSHREGSTEIHDRMGGVYAGDAGDRKWRAWRPPVIVAGAAGTTSNAITANPDWSDLLLGLAIGNYCPQLPAVRRADNVPKIR
jgi:hypothetical protein